MVDQIAKEAMTMSSTKEKPFGRLEIKPSVSDQKFTMIISRLTRHNCKKLRKFLEYQR
jgi:hypothetical protein